MIINPLNALNHAEKRIVDDILIAPKGRDHDLRPTPTVERRPAVVVTLRHNIIAAIDITILIHNTTSYLCSIATAYYGYNIQPKKGNITQFKIYYSNTLFLIIYYIRV